MAKVRRCALAGSCQFSCQLPSQRVVVEVAGGRWIGNILNGDDDPRKRPRNLEPRPGASQHDAVANRNAENA